MQGYDFQGIEYIRCWIHIGYKHSWIQCIMYFPWTKVILVLHHNFCFLNPTCGTFIVEILQLPFRVCFFVVATHSSTCSSENPVVLSSIT